MGHANIHRGWSDVSGEYLLLKWVHILSSTVLFGMGAGIAFFFIRADRTQDVRVIAAVSRDVVLADAVFTAAAVVLQPLTGLAMVCLAGYPWNRPWILLSMVLYVAVGCCCFRSFGCRSECEIWHSPLRLHSRLCQRATEGTIAVGLRWAGPRFWAYSSSST